MAFADSTNAMEPVIMAQDMKEISTSTKPSGYTSTSNYIGDCDIEIKGWDMIKTKVHNPNAKASQPSKQN